jgi:lantibiotic modifying enzyme
VEFALAQTPLLDIRPSYISIFFNMQGSELTHKTKQFIENLLATGEQWLISDLEKIFQEAKDEEDFLEEFQLYLTRLDVKVKTLKDEFSKIFP